MYWTVLSRKLKQSFDKGALLLVFFAMEVIGGALHIWRLFKRRAKTLVLCREVRGYTSRFGWTLEKNASDVDPASVIYLDWSSTNITQTSKHKAALKRY